MFPQHRLLFHNSFRTCFRNTGCFSTTISANVSATPVVFPQQFPQHRLFFHSSFPQQWLFFPQQLPRMLPQHMLFGQNSFHRCFHSTGSYYTAFKTTCPKSCPLTFCRTPFPQFCKLYFFAHSYPPADLSAKLPAQFFHKHLSTNAFSTNVFPHTFFHKRFSTTHFSTSFFHGLFSTIFFPQACSAIVFPQLVGQVNYAKLN